MFYQIFSGFLYGRIFFARNAQQTGLVSGWRGLMNSRLGGSLVRLQIFALAG